MLSPVRLSPYKASAISWDIILISIFSVQTAVSMAMAKAGKAILHRTRPPLWRACAPLAHSNPTPPTTSTDTHSMYFPWSSRERFLKSGQGRKCLDELESRMWSARRVRQSLRGLVPIFDPIGIIVQGNRTGVECIERLEIDVGHPQHLLTCHAFGRLQDFIKSGRDVFQITGVILLS